MKKLVIITSVLGFMCLTGFMSLGNKTTESNKDWNIIGSDSLFGVTAYKIIEVEGHKYIVVRGKECLNTLHAESCSCKTK